MGRTLLPICLNLVGGLLLASVAAVQNPVVTTHYGDLMGTSSEHVSGVNVFKGVPYGGSVAGDNRWVHPPKPPSWNGTKNATEFGPKCAQIMGPVILGEEDCLTLNIWTPDDFSNSTNYPVYFWIYGGRFAVGSANELTYDGSALAAKGAVVVAVNYRLGPFGFLAHPELSAEHDGAYPSGNWGLHDQLAALHWTNHQISLFGGNASQITIGGQSAGASAVIDWVYSPHSAGLFQGAIAESGPRAPRDPIQGSLASSYRDRTRAESQGVAYLEELGVGSVDAARKVSVERLLTTGATSDTVFGGTPFENNRAYPEPPLYRPVLDGYLLPDTYEALLSSGRQNDVPVLMGGNRDDSSAAPSLDIDLWTYMLNNTAIFGPLGLDATFFSLFPARSDAEAAAQTNNFYRNQSLVSMHQWASARAARSDVYAYYWTHAPPGQGAGAFHGSELNYALGNMPWGTTLMGETLSWTGADYAIADAMSQYWFNFIRSGDPNGGGLPRWEPSSRCAKTIMELGDAWGPIRVASDEVIDLMGRYFEREMAY